MTEEEALKSATHRHFKGGLYLLLGPAFHSGTGQPLIDADTNTPILGYLHLWPHEQRLWLRTAAEFNELLPDGRPRFEKLDTEKEL